MYNGLTLESVFPAAHSGSAGLHACYLSSVTSGGCRCQEQEGEEWGGRRVHNEASGWLVVMEPHQPIRTRMEQRMNGGRVNPD